VVGFTMGPFGTIERPWKPFNPILGETFEYSRPETGMKYIAEQVCGMGGAVQGAVQSAVPVCVEPDCCTAVGYRDTGGGEGGTAYG
jgi:hypothetical protein